MKRTIEEVVLREVEINLPHYRTDNICHIYKVYSENETIQVCYDKSWYGIKQIPNTRSAFVNGTTDSTEDEFLIKFDEVYHSLLKL